jgi:hypothetical protein
MQRKTKASEGIPLAAAKLGSAIGFGVSLAGGIASGWELEPLFAVVGISTLVLAVLGAVLGWIYATVTENPKTRQPERWER